MTSTVEVISLQFASGTVYDTEHGHHHSNERSETTTVVSSAPAKLRVLGGRKDVDEGGCRADSCERSGGVMLGSQDVREDN